MPTDYESIAAKYIETFNETDAGKRRALVDALYTEDCRYIDPLTDVSGPRGVDGYLAATQQQFAGVEFSAGTAVEGHHDVLRFQWFAGPPGSDEPLAIGFDVLTLEGDRVKQVVGFLDKAPGS